MFTWKGTQLETDVELSADGATVRWKVSKDEREKDYRLDIELRGTDVEDVKGLAMKAGSRGIHKGGSPAQMMEKMLLNSDLEATVPDSSSQLRSRLRG